MAIRNLCLAYGNYQANIKVNDRFITLAKLYGNACEVDATILCYLQAVEGGSNEAQQKVEHLLRVNANHPSFKKWKKNLKSL